MNDDIPEERLSDYADAWLATGRALTDTATVDFVEDWINNREITERDITFATFASLAFETDKFGGDWVIR